MKTIAKLAVLATVISMMVCSCIKANTSLTFSKNIDNVDVIVTIESESDGKASADISIDSETGREIDATIFFDGNKLQTVDTLPYNNVFHWENLGSSTHTLEIKWLGLDGDTIYLPFMFAGSQSVHLGH